MNNHTRNRSLGLALLALALAALGCNLTGGAQPAVPSLAALPTVTETLPPPPSTATPPAEAVIATLPPPTTAPTDTVPPTLPPTEPPVAACDAVITQALEQVDTLCAGTGRNEACYGHDRVTVALKPGAAGSFTQPSDRIALASLHSLSTSPYDESGEVWGIALLRVQADLPDALPGEAITFLAYGDTSIQDAGGASPMQAVAIRTGLAGPACESAPDSGVLIQNDTGEVASLTVNGVDILVGSTVLVQADRNSDMVMAVLEGRVDALSLGSRVSAAAGTQIRVPLGERLQPLQAPRLETLDLALLQTRPLTPLLDRLPERITLPEAVRDFGILPTLSGRIRDELRPGAGGGLRDRTPSPTPVQPVIITRPPLVAPATQPPVRVITQPPLIVTQPPDGNNTGGNRLPPSRTPTPTFTPTPFILLPMFTLRPPPIIIFPTATPTLPLVY